MKRPILFSFLILIFCAGCSTSYHARGFWGDGYSEVRTNPNAFIVTFKGNQYTHNDEVTRYLLLRASELSLQNGYKYFVVLSSQDASSSYNYVYTDANASHSQGSKYSSKSSSNTSFSNASQKTTSGTVLQPGRSIRIQCFEEKPLVDESIDAMFYWNANRPK